MVQARPLDGAGEISATLERSGDSATLRVQRMPEIGPDEVYEVWIQRGDRVDPISTFVLRADGSAVAAVPGPLEGGDAVLVTREPRPRERAADDRAAARSAALAGTEPAPHIFRPPMATCYRHPQRETNVSCSNCDRPICPDCMTSTSVGMRCPECARQQTKVKNPIGAPTRIRRAGHLRDHRPLRRRLPRRARRRAAPTALDGGGKMIRDFGLFGPAVADGEQYRIVTSAFLHAGLIHLGLNMFVLYILGTLLEPAVGTARFVAIYARLVLGGSFVALLIDPNELTVGASGGIFGLMAAAFLIARHRGLDQLASQLGFFVILNLVFTFSISNISIGAHLGGLAGGALAGLLVTMVESRRPPSAQAHRDRRHAGALRGGGRRRPARRRRERSTSLA